VNRSPYGGPGSAVLSECKRYRYRLNRVFATGTGAVVFVMLNPSTADAEFDDPTVGRCISYARWWGFGRLEVVNLFGLRSTDPAALKRADDPVGPGNDAAIVQAAGAADLIVCAWGSNAAGSGRDQDVIGLLSRADHFLKGRVHCLGLNNDRSPKHPLYLPKTLKPQVWYPR